MTCYSAITYADNNLKSITICSHLRTEFSSTYYNYKGGVFRYIFVQYVKLYIKEIYHPVFIQEWKLKLDTAAYKNKSYAKERLSSKRK